MNKWELMKAMQSSEELLSDGIKRRQKKKKSQGDLHDYSLNDRLSIITRKSSDAITNNSNILNTQSNTPIINTIPDQPRFISRSVARPKPSPLVLLQSIQRPYMILTNKDNEQDDLNANVNSNNIKSYSTNNTNKNIVFPLINNTDGNSPVRRIPKKKSTKLIIATEEDDKNDGEFRSPIRRPTGETVLKLDSNGMICISNDINDINNNNYYGHSPSLRGGAVKEKNNSFLISNNLNFNRRQNKVLSMNCNPNINNVIQLTDIGNSSPSNNDTNTNDNPIISLLRKKDPNSQSHHNIITNPNNKTININNDNPLSPHKYHLKLINPTHHHNKDNSNSPDDSPIIKLINHDIVSTSPNLPPKTKLGNDSNADEIFLIRNYYTSSRRGKDSKGNLKTNQDSFLECPHLYNNQSINLFAVLDGHGSNGHLVSQFVTNYLKAYFTNDQSFLKESSLQRIYHKFTEHRYDFIKNAFISAEAALTKHHNEIDAQLSGTTCVLVIQIGNKIICANTGDSRAIMQQARKTIVPLSYDHKPENPEERKRIEHNGGEVVQDDYGPYRVWRKNEEVPGIAMSRSIGDFIASSIGVIPLPEVKEFELNEESKYIIIASDGIWEFLSNEKVVQLSRKSYKYNNPQKLCELLTDKATECWECEGKAVDDITIISLFF